MICIKHVLLVLTCVSISINAMSQSQADAYEGPKTTNFWNISLTLGMPQGNFKSVDADNPEAGYAPTGFGLSTSHYRSISNGGLYAFGNFSVLINSNRLYEEEIYLYNQDNTGPSADTATLNNPQLVNTPLLLGLAYITETGRFKFYANAGVGASLLMLTKAQIIFNQDNYKSYYSSPGIAPGFGVEAGLIFRDRLKLGLQYMQFAKTTIKTKVEENHQTVEHTDKDFQVSLLNLKLGYAF